jgi:hypothetical protein
MATVLESNDNGVKGTVKVFDDLPSLKSVAVSTVSALAFKARATIADYSRLTVLLRSLPSLSCRPSSLIPTPMQSFRQRRPQHPHPPLQLQQFVQGMADSPAGRTPGIYHRERGRAPYLNEALGCVQKGRGPCTHNCGAHERPPAPGGVRAGRAWRW